MIHFMIFLQVNILVQTIINVFFYLIDVILFMELDENKIKIHKRKNQEKYFDH